MNPSSMAARLVPSLIVNELLDRNNYDDWEFRVEIYLRSKGLWSVVSDPPLKGKKNSEAWEQTNCDALHAIHLCCGNAAFKSIRGLRTAHIAWEALRKFTISGDTESRKESGEEDDVHETAEKEVKEATEGDGVDNHGNVDNIVDAVVVDYEHFFHDAKGGKWRLVMDFIVNHGEAVTKSDPNDGKTVLHHAVEQLKVDIVQKLMQRITGIDELDRRDSFGLTALEYCCYTVAADTDEMLKIANCMVQRKRELGAPGLDYRHLIYKALVNKKPKLAEYLYGCTEFDTHNDPYAADVISLSFSTKRFDIAWMLIQQNPIWAITEASPGISPLNVLASTPSAFLSGSRLKFWEKWIYHEISGRYRGDIGRFRTLHLVTIKDVPTDENDKDELKRRHIRSGLKLTGYFKSSCQKAWNRFVTAMFHGLKIKICKIFGISRIYEIYEMNVNHARVHKTLKCIIRQVLTAEKMKHLDAKKTALVKEAIFQAAKRGLVDFLTDIFQVNPELAGIQNQKGQNLFQVAVQYRQAEVFHLIHGLNQDNRKACMSEPDDDGNNMLHMMGIFSPNSQTNLIRGAALQMQNELQWFKELERMASPEDLEAENDTCMTPSEFFSRNHTQMVKEAEKSMKDTATSCTVVGALMVTMMFAVAFTLPAPQENKDNVTLLSRRAFRVFIIADAISLFTSTTSVVLFLGILTSRYAEEDFLRSLPQKMILGLLTLFLSVAAMVIVFASALFIILPSNTYIALPITLVAGIPIASFIWMQFPFLLEIFYSTYIRRLFNMKKVLVKLNVGKKVR